MTTRNPSPNPSTAITLPVNPSVWDQASYDFLVQKSRRSGSQATFETYRMTLAAFFGVLRKTPDQVTVADVGEFAYGTGRWDQGLTPAPASILLRLAILSSFFRFLVSRDLVPRNVVALADRPRKPRPNPKSLGPGAVKRLLSVIPDTPAGRRDRAITIVGLITARRRAEILGLRAGDIDDSGGMVTYQYRGKGGVVKRRELPKAAHDALVEYLGGPVGELPPDELLFPIHPITYYTRLRGYLQKAGLPPAGVHLLRHTGARARRRAGQSLEELQAFLDHASVQTTSVYIQQMEGVEDPAAGRAANIMGIGDEEDET